MARKRATPVLDEIDDLFSAKDKDVEFVFKGKSLQNTEGSGAQGSRSGTRAVLTIGHAHVVRFSMRAVAWTYCPHRRGSTS
jgi:hypothetical protein